MGNPTSISWRSKSRWRTRSLLALAMAMPIVGLHTSAVDAVSSPSVVVYDSIGSDIPGNVVSVGFQATQSLELGDMVLLGNGPRILESVTVLMASWGCESRPAGVCTTTDGATFDHPLTMKLYAVSGPDSAPVLGSVLATTTQTFAIPYRPSQDDTNCTGGSAGKWFDAGSTTCFNGLSTPVTFTFTSSPTLPSRVVWGISYNTTSYGTTPLGTGASCFSTPQGCGYDSLNVGVESLPGAPFVGTDVSEDAIFYNTLTAAWYCDGGPTTGTFRHDGSPGCWTGYRPLAKITTKFPSVNTVVVRSSNLQDWVVDTTLLDNAAVPFSFAGPADEGSGFGSFRFGPVAGAGGAKQEMQPPLINSLVSDFGGLQYDFQVITPVSGDSANQFYTNVYVDSSDNGIGVFGSGSFYDCRYAFVPSSSVAGWNTFSFSSSTVTPIVTSKIGVNACGSSIADAPGALSQIEFFRLNGGDTTASDNGLEGAYDLVSLTSAGNTTTYDFETEAETVFVRPAALQDWIVDTTALGNPAVPFSFAGPADNAAGAASFRFGPIAGAGGAKQEMQPPLINSLVSDFGGMRYDFQVITPVAGESANQFYTNVYVDSSDNGIGVFGSGSFYDCRYAFVPSSSVAGWNTFSFDSSTVTPIVTSKIGVNACGSSIADTPGALSQIEFFRLNGGDTTASDNGLEGAYDLVSLTSAGATTTYNFEDAPVIPPPITFDNVRIMDTRTPGGKTVDGLHQAGGRLAANQTYELDVAGRAGLPPTAETVVFNVTAVSALAPGFITVFECGLDRPNASNINFQTGEVVANSVSTRMAANGKICIYTSAATDLLVDVTGILRGLTPLAEPARVLDTRTPFGETADGLHQGVGRLAAGSTYELPVAGRVGVDPGAATVVLNVASLLPSTNGFITVFPCGEARPNASNLNFVVGDQIANQMLARVGVDGKVCIYTSADTNVIADVSGYFAGVVELMQLPTPSRMLDTRSPGGTTVDHQHQAVGRVAAGSTYELQITGRIGIPVDTEAVVLNVTAVQPSARGFLTVYACGDPLPNASNLNFLRGDVIPNMVLVSVGTGGKVCVFSSAATDLIVDISGYFGS